MVLVGFVGNTVSGSMCLRLTLAEFSNGPMLIGMLKAIINTVSAPTGRRMLDARDADLATSGTIT